MPLSRIEAMTIPAADPLMTLRDATFGYNGIPVIRNVSLSVHRGEFIGLIGPNGAGKSTLFKGLLRLILPMSGEVIHSPEILYRIGYVPQREQLDAIYPLVSWDVVRMGIVGALPWYQWAGSKSHAPLIEQCLERVGMSTFRDASFAELSGGQRQRVLIARALAARPQILVLDEPTAGIDPVAEESILSLLGDLNLQQKITILMVSHHIQSLRSRVSRVVVVNEQTILTGSAEDLLRPERIAELLAANL
jgi:ABC-type Mn2+/Zn2+ transport system ATPase subunit